MEKRKPELILVRGLPGSGKSTLAKRFPRFYHVEADMFWGPDYDFDIDRIVEAHQWCIKTTENYLINGESVIVSNTFTSLDEMEPYFKIAFDLGINVTSIIAQGGTGSVHGVPESAMIEYERRFQYDAAPLFKKYFG